MNEIERVNWKDILSKNASVTFGVDIAYVIK